MEGDPFEPPSCFVNRFLSWAERAEGSDLVKALRVISADGGRRVPGRSRGDGKRSTERLEPQVLGQVRGSPGPKAEGGRPSEKTRQELVMHLATDWLQATGQSPERGRSDQTGFGELAHSIFGWLDFSKDPYEAATHPSGAFGNRWRGATSARHRRISWGFTTKNSEPGTLPLLPGLAPGFRQHTST
jgi:hypothetical protein